MATILGIAREVAAMTTETAERLIKLISEQPGTKDIELISEHASTISLKLCIDAYGRSPDDEAWRAALFVEAISDAIKEGGLLLVAQHFDGENVACRQFNGDVVNKSRRQVYGARLGDGTIDSAPKSLLRCASMQHRGLDDPLPEHEGAKFIDWPL